MKKLFLLAVSCIFAVSVFAQSKTDSCKIEGVPGAYVTAQATATASGNGTDFHVVLRSYGVQNAAVTVEIEFGSGSGNKVEEMGYIEDGKGEVNIRVGGGSQSIRSVKIYNAVCR